MLEVYTIVLFSSLNFSKIARNTVFRYVICGFFKFCMAMVTIKCSIIYGYMQTNTKYRIEGDKKL